MIKEYKLNRSNCYFLLSTVITTIKCGVNVFFLYVMFVPINAMDYILKYSGMMSIGVFFGLCLFSISTWSILEIHFKYISLSRGMVIFWDSDNCELRFNYFGKDFIVTKEKVKNITIVGTLSTIAKHSHVSNGFGLYGHFIYAVIKRNDGLQIVFTNMIAPVEKILVKFENYNTRRVVFPYIKFTKAVEQLGVEESNT